MQIKAHKESTNIELRSEQSAIVLNPDGSIDCAYLPEAQDQEDADEGMLMIAQVLMTASNPKLRKIIEQEFEENAQGNKSKSGQAD